MGGKSPFIKPIKRQKSRFHAGLYYTTLLNLSLSTFIRRAIHNVKIEKTVIVAGGGEETLTAVSTLLAQCSKVGSNLNQLARHFNSGGADTEQIRAKLLDELADLTAFRLHAEKVLGELYGNAQAYRL